MKKIRLGFIGAGLMGQMAHLRNYSAHPHCEVVALAELRPNLAREVATRYGIPRVYPDHRALLTEGGIDALVVIQQFTIHGQLLPDILSHGLPVLVEKPLARSTEVAAKLVELAGLHGTPLYIAYHKRSDPASVALKKTIQDWKENGRYGNLRYIRITMPPGNWMAEGTSSLLRSEEIYPKSEEDPPPKGLSASHASEYLSFVNYYIHQVNFFSYLLEEEYTVTNADPGGIYLGIRSRSGVTGLLEMAPYHTTRDWQESVLVAFDKGWMKLELPAPLAIDRPGHLTIFQDAGGADEPLTWSPVLPDWHAMRAQADFFLRAVQGEKTPLCQADQGLRDLQVSRDYLDLLRGKEKTCRTNGDEL